MRKECSEERRPYVFGAVQAMHIHNLLYCMSRLLFSLGGGARTSFTSQSTSCWWAPWWCPSLSPSASWGQQHWTTQEGRPWHTSIKWHLHINFKVSWCEVEVALQMWWQWVVSTSVCVCVCVVRMYMCSRSSPCAHWCGASSDWCLSLHWAAA